MRYLAVFVAMLASVPAYAMGRYVNLELRAWNADGSAALVARTETSSGTVGTTHTFILVAAGAQPREFTFDDTQDGDTAVQKVDRASCLRAADALSRELATKRFRVTIRRAACDGDRGVVTVPLATLRESVDSMLTAPPNGPASPRQTAMWDAAKAVVGGDLSNVVVAAKSGALVVVLWGENGDSSGPAHATVVDKGVIGPDLR
jgi:hypothetical protein